MRVLVGHSKDDQIVQIQTVLSLSMVKCNRLIAGSSSAVGTEVAPVIVLITI